MSNKIRFGASIVALVLFFLPWIDIQFSGTSVITQTGFQAVFGDGSTLDQINALNGSNNSKLDEDSDESLGTAPMVGVALVTAFGATVFAGIALFCGGRYATTISSVLSAIALALIVFQVSVGFPVKQEIIDTMSVGTSQKTSFDDELDEYKEVLANAEAMIANAQVLMAFRIKMMPLFYLELIGLGIPALLMVNSFIDKYKKSEQDSDAEEAI